MTTSTAAPGLGLRRLSPVEAGVRLDDILSRPYEYRSWEDVYREQWTWDRVVKVTHTRVNCISACSLDAYVKDGIVWREEQNATYEKAFEDTPDFNPRGCPMGCVYSGVMYDPTRVKYPMKRAGKRGEGKWERISWDQALTEIADRLIDVAVEDGPECIVYDNGTTNLDFGIGSPMEGHVFTRGLGSTTIDSYAGVGDLPVGLIQSWGLYMSEGTSDDWFHSDYILMWIGNPSYTRVPEAHFLWEARYRGAKVVSIAPDFNASTIHADRWLNVRYATDAALALGMAHVIVNEGLYKTDYIKEQTDLPFLVRDDTGKFLRESDVVEDGSEGLFYVWDAATGRKVNPPGTWNSDSQTIALGDLDPELEGAHRVRLKDGRRVTVRPVFELLRKRLDEYTPERAAEITGVHANNIRRVAREFAAAGSAMIYSSWGACKHYHSDLFQRGMTYLCALTGNSGGKPGSGIKVSTWWPPPNGVLTGGRLGAPSTVRLQTDPAPELPIDRIGVQELSKMTFGAGRLGAATPLIPWLYAHDPKWAEVAARDAYNDPALKRPVKEYIDEALDLGWQPISPPLPKRPKFLYFSGPNPLRRWPNPRLIRDSLWASIDTIVTLDFRMSTSALWSDYVLPGCGYYEKPGIKYTSTYIPYTIVGDRAVEPLYESKHEWDFALLLAQKIQERARERGVEAYTDRQGAEHDLQTLYDDISADGAYEPGEQGEERALDYIMQYSSITRHSELGEGAWGKAVEKGMVKIKHIQPSALAIQFNSVYTDYTEDEPLYSCGWFVNRKNPWPTLTGRQQFYIDHDWFMEVGEALVVHKEPLNAGGNFPLRLTGGHTRWSMHSIWRASEDLLRLQRGEPVAYISVPDAQQRGIKDHDRIRVYNDVGSFELRAKISPAAQPGTVIVYHAWEGYQFKNWATQNDVVPGPLKPTNFVGNYGQLHYRMASYTMNHIPKEVAVDVEKLEEPA